MTMKEIQNQHPARRRSWVLAFVFVVLVVGAIFTYPRVAVLQVLSGAGVDVASASDMHITTAGILSGPVDASWRGASETPIIDGGRFCDQLVHCHIDPTDLTGTPFLNPASIPSHDRCSSAFNGEAGDGADANHIRLLCRIGSTYYFHELYL